MGFNLMGYEHNWHNYGWLNVTCVGANVFVRQYHRICPNYQDGQYNRPWHGWRCKWRHGLNVVNIVCRIICRKHIICGPNIAIHNGLPITFHGCFNGPCLWSVVVDGGCDGYASCRQWRHGNGHDIYYWIGRICGCIWCLQPKQCQILLG